MTSILVVEDNPMNMELVAYLLKSNGMEVTQTFDGLEALEMLKKNSFDLILLDIQLPGMDGMEVLKNIKENPTLRHMSVVALTAHAMQGDEAKFIDAGCVGYISKPLDVSTFIGTVQSFMNKGA
ncbi:response regulator [uncultured Methanomethylovorans sp.]|uniref:response regulator n=1 Tax=uncultured Methanomethylovorans sp. TaxID=183759 RepID=UPI002AA62D73|nr:response regulator [uncultured Methanomethylovorans sp.]